MKNLALMWVLAACLLGCGGKPSDTTFTDSRDGKVYRIVKIGRQTWFAENLNYLVIGVGSSCYGDDADSCAKYGRLYDWETAKQICPVGWRLPSDDDWAALMAFVGGDSTAGERLKSTSGWDYAGWNRPWYSGTDDFGFSALPGGYGYSNGSFFYASSYGFWWSATDSVASFALYRNMNYDSKYVSRHYFSKALLLSVRCVLDD